MPQIVCLTAGSAGVPDATAIASLARAARFDAIPNLPDLHSPEEDVAFYRALVTETDGCAYVDDTGEVLGFVIWREALIEHLYVDVDHQRQGIGSALLAAALSRIPVRPVRLWTFAANERAVAFYRRHGFREVERTDGSGNEERLPDILFELP